VYQSIHSSLQFLSAQRLQLVLQDLIGVSVEARVRPLEAPAATKAKLKGKGNLNFECMLLGKGNPHVAKGNTL